jgi:hypothetical protein
MTKQRREGEADGPQGQRPARVSRRGPSWTEFVRLADQAVVAITGAGMINRAEPRACGYSRGSRRLDPEPETERTAGPALNAAGDGCGRVQDDQAGFQPYWGKPAVRNEQRGRRKRGQDLMAICHDARKGRHTGSHRSKPVAPPLLCSLRSLTCLQVQVLPRQWMVGPSSHSRPWLGETPTGASSAVNGRASRWRKLPARTGQPL